MSQQDLFAAAAPSTRSDVPFFNTVELHGPPLAKARATADEQQKRVLAVFRSRPGAHLAPSQVWTIGQVLDPKPWLLTSVRRAMTTLTDAGRLRKLSTLRDGPYGKPEHLWEEVR